RRHTRSKRDWSSDVCSSDLGGNFDTTGQADTCDFTQRGVRFLWGRGVHASAHTTAHWARIKRWRTNTLCLWCAALPDQLLNCWQNNLRIFSSSFERIEAAQCRDDSKESLVFFRRLEGFAFGRAKRWHLLRKIPATRTESYCHFETIVLSVTGSSTRGKFKCCLRW